MGHDPVAIVIGIARYGDVKTILELDEPLHGEGARAVHPDLAVTVDRHERELGVDIVVDDVDLEVVSAGNVLPVAQARPPERVDPNGDPRRTDRVHVDGGA